MAKKQEQIEDKGVEVLLIPTDGKASKRLYANFVQIQNTPFDMSLRFCDAIPFYDTPQEQKKVRLEIPVVAEIVLPYDVVPNLISALELKYKHFLSAKEKAHDAKNQRKADSRKPA